MLPSICQEIHLEDWLVKLQPEAVACVFTKGSSPLAASIFNRSYVCVFLEGTEAGECFCFCFSLITSAFLLKCLKKKLFFTGLVVHYIHICNPIMYIFLIPSLPTLGRVCWCRLLLSTLLYNLLTPNYPKINPVLEPLSSYSNFSVPIVLFLTGIDSTFIF